MSITRDIATSSGVLHAISIDRAIQHTTIGLTAMTNGTGGSFSPIQQLVQAIDRGDLHFNDGGRTQTRGDAAVVRAAAAGTGHVDIAPQIVDLLNNLLNDGRVGVLSLFYRDHGQHGVRVGSRYSVRAVDINAFGGQAIQVGRLRSPNHAPGEYIGNPETSQQRTARRDRTIQIISQILERFPEGDFDIGFPRPVGYNPPAFCHIDDVFFPVPDFATAARCLNNAIGFNNLHTMLQPARDAVYAAIHRSRATFHLFYPDGLDHLHVALARRRR